jgi:hypothetical protein
MVVAKILWMSKMDSYYNDTVPGYGKLSTPFHEHLTGS